MCIVPVCYNTYKGNISVDTILPTNSVKDPDLLGQIRQFAPSGQATNSVVDPVGSGYLGPATIRVVDKDLIGRIQMSGTGS
jgi:hypothetical protein